MLRAIGKLFKWIFILAFIVVLIGVLCVGYAHFIEPNRLTVTETQDTSYSMKEPITVAVFADTHFGFQYDTDMFQKVVDKVNENPPDILLFAGDLIDNLSQYNKDTSEISEKLSMMKANMGKYAVFGNHDYGGGAEYKYESIMKKGGFKVLVNETVTFRKNNLRLIGIDDLLIGYGDPSVVNKADSSMYNLVLCHEPDIVEKILDSNTDYMVAGHTHGGQIRVPFYTEKFLPSYGEKYVKGSYELNNNNKTVLYVNSGLGTTKIPARFMAVPELTYITISPHNS
ncbi:metallophosphoesterase [Anaerovorax odorimutans]|uniref:Metallophosphoesterase n=1 Tax=Anaerovorax odorimutans TaxID=109327 RepID=A0ABT1RME5_9FIRM|nr:metallophosphoesterase [Anaerovorax odorimutans]MCQ4636352.1 metallophosphoesterase [Anaerovorax odorimutans]